MTPNRDPAGREQLAKLRRLVDEMEQEAIESSELWPAINLLEVMGDHFENWRQYKTALELLRSQAIVDSPKLKEYMLADEAYQQAWNRAYPNGIELEVA